MVNTVRLKVGGGQYYMAEDDHRPLKGRSLDSICRTDFDSIRSTRIVRMPKSYQF